MKSLLLKRKSYARHLAQEKTTIKTTQEKKSQINNREEENKLQLEVNITEDLYISLDEIQARHQQPLSTSRSSQWLLCYIASVWQLCSALGKRFLILPPPNLPTLYRPVREPGRITYGERCYLYLLADMHYVSQSKIKCFMHALCVHMYRGRQGDVTYRPSCTLKL